jgi:anti-sigma-K factor RskA
VSAHSQVEDLLAGYALGAASAEEAGMVRAHLPECDECRGDLARLTEAVSVLALTVEEVAPPPRLRQRIQAAVRRRDTPIAALTADAIELEPVPRRAWFRPSLRSTWLPAAAAAAAIIAGLLAWNVRLQNELSTRHAPPGTSGIVTAPMRGPQGTVLGTVTLLRQQRVALVGLRNLASPSAGRTLELWVIDRQGKPRPAGVFTPDPDGTKLLVVPQDVSGDTLAVTDEPFGGSLLPTTTPFVTGSM